MKTVAPTERRTNISREIDLTKFVLDFTACNFFIIPQYPKLVAPLLRGPKNIGFIGGWRARNQIQVLAFRGIKIVNRIDDFQDHTIPSPKIRVNVAPLPPFKPVCKLVFCNPFKSDGIDRTIFSRKVFEIQASAVVIQHKIIPLGLRRK